MTLRIEIHESFPPTIVGEDTSFNLHACDFILCSFCIRRLNYLLTYLLCKSNKISLKRLKLIAPGAFLLVVGVVLGLDEVVARVALPVVGDVPRVSLVGEDYRCSGASDGDGFHAQRLPLGRNRPACVC